MLAVTIIAFYGQIYSQGTATVNLIMPGGICATMSYIGVYCEFTFPDNREQPFIVGPLMNKDFTSVSVSPGPIKIDYIWLDQSKMQGTSYEYIKSSIGTERERPTKGSYQNTLADGEVKYLSPFPVFYMLGKKAAYQINYNDTVYEEVKQEQYEKWVLKISGKRGAVAGDLPSSGPNKIPVVRPQQGASVVAQTESQTEPQTESQEPKDPQKPQEPQEPQLRKTSGVKFGMYYGATGAVGKGKGMDKVGGAVGPELVIGARLWDKHIFLGPGVGVNWYFYNAENSYGKTETRFVYMPIFANARAFVFGDKKKNDIYLDMDLGGFVAFKPTTTFIPKGGKSSTITGDTGGGLFFHIGAGVKLSMVNIGAGYELRKAKDADGVSSAYFKLEFSF